MQLWRCAGGLVVATLALPPGVAAPLPRRRLVHGAACEAVRQRVLLLLAREAVVVVHEERDGSHEQQQQRHVAHV